MDDPLLTFLLKYKLALIFSNSNINYFIIPPTIWHTFISKSIMVVPLWWKYFLYSLQKEVDTLPAFAKIIRSSKQYISWSKEIQHIYLQKHSGQSKSIQLEIVYKCVYTYVYEIYTHLCAYNTLTSSSLKTKDKFQAFSFQIWLWNWNGKDLKNQLFTKIEEEVGKTNKTK